MHEMRRSDGKLTTEETVPLAYIQEAADKARVFCLQVSRMSGKARR